MPAIFGTTSQGPHLFYHMKVILKEEILHLFKLYVNVVCEFQYHCHCHKALNPVLTWYQILSQNMIITKSLLQEECENQYLPLFRFTPGNAAQVLDKNVRVSP